MRRLLIALLALLLAPLVSGCGGSRVVTIERPAPPPSVVTVTDTVLLASPPDTVFAPPETLRVTETVPLEVIRYVEPRPDTARAALVWRLAVDSADVLVSLRQEDLRLRAPVPGERLTCIAIGPEDLECRVEGEPVAPSVQRIECPACPDCLVPSGLRGFVRLFAFVSTGAVVGFIARSVLG